MVKINFNKFLENELVTIKEMSEALRYPAQSFYTVKRRNTISIPMLKMIEEKYPNIMYYIKHPKAKTNNFKLLEG